MSIFERERTSTEAGIYAHYLYFPGLSFINTSKAIYHLEKEEGMLPYGNGFKGSINQSNIDVFTVVKEYLLF